MWTFLRFFFFVACLAFGPARLVPAADPLDRSPSLLPSVVFTESESDKVTGVAGSRVVTTSRSTSATIVASMAGLSLASINGSTAFALNFGSCSVSFTLADVPTYTVGQTTAFYCWNGWDAAQKPKGTTGVRLTWSATKLTIVLTMTNEASRPDAIASMGFEGAVDPGTGGAIALKDQTTVDFSFGAIASTQRRVYFTGKSSVTHVFYNNTVQDDEEFDLNSITLSGAAEYVLPTVSLVSPPQNGSVGSSVTVTGKAVDGYGLDRVLWSPDPPSPSSWVDVSSFIVSPPADGLWGLTTATWTLDLTGLPHGITKVWVKSIDESRNESAPLAISLVRAMPALLMGRWDATMVPVAFGNEWVGAIRFTIVSNGTYTGSYAVQGATYAFGGGLLADETLRAVIKRTGKPDVVITAAFGSFSPGTVATASLNGSVAVNGATETSFTARRSPFSSTVLADASLAGRFHAVDSTTGGYLIATTARTGAATVAGKLSDGSAVTWAGVFGADGSVPVFVPLYLSKGSASGTLKIDGPTRTIPASTFYWQRPPAYSDKQYPAGFATMLQFAGSAYLAPLVNTRVLGLASTANNATATWEDPDGGMTPHTQSITVNSNNTISIPATVDALKLAVVPSTGLWTGTMKVSGTTALANIYLLSVGTKATGFYIAPPVTGSVLKRFGTFSVQ